jgi:exosortase
MTQLLQHPIVPAPAEGGPAAAPRYDYAGARRSLIVPSSIYKVLLVLGLVAGVLFAWTFDKMWVRWTTGSGYYSHGPLVLPIALGTAWLIIRQRGLPMKSTPSSRWIGMTLVVGSVLLHLLCVYSRITVVSGFTLLSMIVGTLLYLGGWAMLRRLWFPVAFLAFMVPLPDVTIFQMNFHLKMFAAEKSAALVNIFGVPAYRNGSNIFLMGDRQLTVDDVCGGLRSLISLLAFSMLFTYACRLRGYARFILFLSAIPIAVAANIVRITTLILTANAYGVKLATPGGWVHDTMGFVLFVVAFSMMFLEEELLLLLPGARRGAWIMQGAEKVEPTKAVAVPA